MNGWTCGKENRWECIWKGGGARDKRKKERRKDGDEAGNGKQIRAYSRAREEEVGDGKRIKKKKKKR